MRPEKPTIVEDVKLRLNNSPFLIVVEYGGMNVNHFAELRSRLGGAGASLTVIKNTFLRRSIKDAGLPDLDAHLVGQTAFVVGEKDICASAKILKTFAAEFEKPTIRVGVLDNSVLDTAQVIALADLPPKEVLQAQLLGLLLSPATKLVRTLNEPGASLARVLAAMAEKAPAAPVVEAPAVAAVEEPAAPVAEVSAEVPAVEAAAAPEVAEAAPTETPAA
ncbi:MAG: 50S ribosomal protein L10 [Chthoniobacterales bacterium]|nr:50S ribosomal protein L10 [Chthoniobacterales bacterium]